MPRITPRPNDSANIKERLNKTIDHFEKAEAAMEFADGKELAAIKAKNARRKESIDGMKSEIIEQDKSKINGYL